MEEQIIETAFKINPENVYGFLIAILLIAILALWRMNAVLRKKIEQYLIASITEKQDTNAALDRIDTVLTDLKTSVNVNN